MLTPKFERVTNCEKFRFYKPGNFHVGPSHWYQAYPVCKEDRQSPINIDTDKATDYDDILPVHYHSYEGTLTGGTIVNNGHTGMVAFRFRLATPIVNSFKSVSSIYKPVSTWQRLINHRMSCLLDLA